MIDQAHIDTIVTAPSMVEDMSRNKSSLERLSKLRAVSFGGGQYLDGTLRKQLLIK
jgi:hypothetical protein